MGRQRSGGLPQRHPDEPRTEPGPGVRTTRAVSAGRLSVDPAEVARQAQALDDAARLVRAQHSALMGGLASLGEFWGTDETGSSFAGNYVPSRDGISDGIANVADILNSMSEGLRKNAEGFARTEADAADGMRRVGAHTESD